MIFYLTKVVDEKEKQQKILGYFESLADLEKTVEENKDELELDGNGRIYQMKPGLNPVRELVRTL